MSHLPLLARFAALLAVSLPVAAQACAVTSVGKVPLDDPAGGLYAGNLLGLWPGGANVPPAAHQAAGLAAANAIVPLDAGGAPSPSGRVVLLSIGMSNATQEFSTWIPTSDADPARSTAVTVVDGAQGGQHAAIVADATSAFWTIVDTRLAAAGVTRQQVQAVWLKEAMAAPTAAFPTHALQLRDYLAQIARNLRVFYPNVRVCFLSSRIYAGYATTALNPEPYAYESGFAVRWVIEQQITGDPLLNHDPAVGPVLAPWLGWGPYTWADGTTPRASDGLTWDCTDYITDGTHPGTTGRAKVAAMLDAFFRTDAFATPWYLQPGTAVASVTPHGTGCGGALGIPTLVADGLPVLGNQLFRIGVRDAAANRFALLALCAAAANQPLAGACTLLVDPAQQILTPVLVTNASGRAIAPLPVPATPTLMGLQVHMQWAIDDPAGAAFPPFAGLAMTRAAVATVGL